jgi:uncharacterized protein YbjT (DUF2867 family)
MTLFVPDRLLILDFIPAALAAKPKGDQTMATKPILVIGGNGKTGRRVIERLSARQLAVRGVSRSSQPAFDWENPSTWSEALRGVGSIYVTYYPDIAVPGSVEAIQSLVQQARDSDVARLVLLSGRGEPEAQRCEDVVRKSGLDWSILRCAWFAQNFSESFLQEPIVAGEVSLPAGDVGEPFVDADDIADVAVAALTEDRHAGQLYELTGPRLLTFAEAVAEIGRATGRVIRYTSVPIGPYRAALEQAGVPPVFTELITYLFREVLDGRNASLADGVQRALGRAPRDFGAYVRAAAGAWSRAA